MEASSIRYPAFAGQEGEFELRRLGDLEYVVKVDVPPEFLDVQPAKTRAGARGVVLALTRGSEQRITVLDDRGAPVSGARLWLLSLQDGVWDSYREGAHTDARGVAVLAGLLDSLTEERVNMVNADIIADSRGLSVTEQKESTCENYANMLTVEVNTTAGKTLVSGSSLRGRTHLTRMGDYWLEMEPVGSYMLFTEHKDRPGMIGVVGTIIGNADINISQMQVSRGVHRGGGAMMVLCLDDPITEECYQQLRSIPDMYKVLTVKLNK